MGGAFAGHLARFIQASGAPALERHFIETSPHLRAAPQHRRVVNTWTVRHHFSEIYQ